MHMGPYTSKVERPARIARHSCIIQPGMRVLRGAYEQIEARILKS
ncbi:MAG: hypothetical protein AABX51_02075 [Nanoarchaeota archaeon]